MSESVDQVLDSVQAAEPSDVVIQEVVSEASEEEDPVVSEEVGDQLEESEPVSTQEVVQNIQGMLSTETNSLSVDNSDLENRVKVSEERLDKLIELLRSSFSQYEYDGDEIRWSCNMLKIREVLNEL